jgi:hypothetical protein
MRNDRPLSLLPHTAYREDDWRRADEVRRVQARPDARPAPEDETVWRRPLMAIRRLIPRHG